MAGLAFLDGTTVMPVLLSRLGADDRLIGLTRVIQTLGFTLPALFAAHYIHGRAEHKPFLLATCGLARLGLLSLPIVLLAWGTRSPALSVAWILAVIGLFWLMDGACAVSWFDIVAKTIPARVRGRFFGAMQAVGGLGAIGAGVVVAAVLDKGGLPFPASFALLAGLWCVGAAVSQTALFLIREPHGATNSEEPRPGFVAYLRQAGPLLRSRPRVARLIAMRVLVDGAGMAAPFYILFAQQHLGTPDRMIGVLAVVQSVGRLATGPLWGWICDRFGTSRGVRAVAVCVLATPACALIAAHGAPWLLPVVFVLMGATQDGVWMVASSALLESVGDRDRPLALGAATVCQTPTALYGFAGGLIAQWYSYEAAFTAALVVTALGLVAALRVQHVRPGMAAA